MASSLANTSCQLDFYEAMADFEVMFPTLEEEIIEAVLRSNNGQVDATIDQLLSMTMEADDMPPPSLTPDPRHQYQVDESWRMNMSEMSAAPHGRPIDSGAGAVHHTNLVPDPWTSEKNHHLVDYRGQHQAPMSYREPHDITSVWSDSTERNATYQNCVTPRIPKELLELIPSSDEDDDHLTYGQQIGQQMGHYPQNKNVIVETDFLPEPPVVPEKTLESTKEPTPERIQRLLRNPRWRPAWLGPLPATFLRIEESGTLGVPTFLAETSSGIKSKSRGSQRCEAPTTVSTPRSSAVVPSCNAVNTELFKEDERIAMMLQNDEFIHELQSDKTFMNLLHRDHLNATAFENHSHVGAPSSQIDESLTTTGYGDHDINSQIPRFPLSGNIDGSAPTATLSSTPHPHHHHHHHRYDDFRRRLKHMSKTSKQRFSDLAKLFVRNKRTNNNNNNDKHATTTGATSNTVSLKPHDHAKKHSTGKRFEKFKDYSIEARQEGYNLLDDD